MRFNSFESNWHEIEISTLIKEVNVKTSDFITYPLYSFTIEDGVTPKTDRYERGFLVKKEGELFKIINNNNFIINPMNLRFGAINFSRINKPVSVSGYYDIFTIDNCNYNHFWNAYFKNNKTLHRYNQIATGSLEEKKRVYFNQFIKMKFKVPNNDEKRKINELISLIEQRVLTQKKIINNYKSLINGLIKMYFSNKGLCEVGKKIALNDILIEGNKIPVDTKQYPKITIKLNKEGISFSNLNRKMADTRPFYIRNKNEIIIGKQNYFNGSIAIIPEEYDNTICSNAIMSFKVKKDFNLKFIYYSISNDLFLKYRSHLANGTGQKELSEKDFLSFKIILPDEGTQNRIVNNIEKIIEKLQLEKKILFLYERQKQYLLDKLFI